MYIFQIETFSSYDSDFRKSLYFFLIFNIFYLLNVKKLKTLSIILSNTLISNMFFFSTYLIHTSNNYCQRHSSLIWFFLYLFHPLCIFFEVLKILSIITVKYTYPICFFFLNIWSHFLWPRFKSLVSYMFFFTNLVPPCLYVPRSFPLSLKRFLLKLKWNHVIYDLAFLFGFPCSASKSNPPPFHISNLHYK